MTSSALLDNHLFTPQSCVAASRCAGASDLYRYSDRPIATGWRLLASTTGAWRKTTCWQLINGNAITSYTRDCCCGFSENGKRLGFAYHQSSFICQEHIQHNVEEEQIAYGRCNKAEVQH